jgi:hypothetical protein
MTANAGYKTFNTGDVLTAAQVQFNLQNQSVMYFATTTARDAALTGSILVDGMVSYTPATGLMYYNGTAWTAVSGTASPLTTKGDVYGYSTTNARIPVGTNNQVLTADSSTALGVKWATPSTGSLTLLSTTTLSGATTTISSISQSYTHLFCSWYGVNGGTAASLYANPNATNTITSISGVSKSTVFGFANGAFYIAGSNTNVGAGNTANGGWFWIYNYSSTSVTNKGVSTGSRFVDGASSNSSENSAGAIGTATAISSLVFGGLTSFSAGTVLLYGVN